MKGWKMKLLQLKMSLLLLFLVFIRTPSALLAGPVATAKAERGVTCQQEVPVELIRDLWNRTVQLIDSLPKEENFSGGWRLLPAFCTRCPEHAIGWLEIREMIDVYQQSVLSSDVIQKLLPLHYNDLLYRLHHTLQSCVSSYKPSEKFNLIKKLQKKIKKKNGGDVALKAVREFPFILRWIDELAQHHIF